MHEFRFDPVRLPASAQALRGEVRAFIAEQLAQGCFDPRVNSWGSRDPAFSKACGERGYIGMCWPKEYGGHERSALERYVVVEEMLALGAPVGAHWVADRQSGNQILKHGSERARRQILPQICAGECFFSIGMSEPDSGSDLAAVRTKAVKVDGGWKISGSKVWTSGAHQAHYLIALVRTAPLEDDRHAGMTQFIIDTAKPGFSTRPIYNLYGGHDFNECIFDEYFVEDDMVLGGVGSGWRMVTGELAFERSGPDRFMSTFQLLLESMRQIGTQPNEQEAAELGRLIAHLATLRRMSTSIAGQLELGANPAIEAALVKDIGTTFEREVPEVFRKLIGVEPSLGRSADYAENLGLTTLRAPSYTLRGGTREILRGMIARGLGLR
ncbi:MAG: acyl-CoA dehydrogenase family protein [Quisquiliibacterium sp.]